MNCGEISYEGRHIATDVVPNRIVEELVLGGSDHGEPVRAGSLLTNEETVEEPCRTRVVHDSRQILATHLIDVIDSNISRYDVVTRWPMRTFPLDEPG
ncbi:MAG: hypothetical protein ACRDZ9_04005 [Acidimicrobiales bacterium]